MRTTGLLLVTAIALAGCSALNPRNWFDRQEVVTLAPEGGYVPVAVDGRPLVDQVATVNVERTPGGVIVRATGVPPTQEYWDAELVQIETPDLPASTIRYEFRLRGPIGPANVGSVPSREIEVGKFISNPDLAGVSTITVTGARNAVSRSR
ncbi:hypothetical protein [Qingshengfaniella alkalisoli]|uniref:Lipoprotein n=1 Tax=Qingshengfaniella alkalisoli TaxID=2599296 RepID=A0A5B8IUT1_9RHOB|nr:hypothetical protein [Qingshengfaniella alkalisoli]QDY69193.1 hypothetical protein FPZ52_05795 [Qingshengfaniella alkalisoli]